MSAVTPPAVDNWLNFLGSAVIGGRQLIGWLLTRGVVLVQDCTALLLACPGHGPMDARLAEDKRITSLAVQLLDEVLVLVHGAQTFGRFEVRLVPASTQQRKGQEQGIARVRYMLRAVTVGCGCDHDSRARNHANAAVPGALVREQELDDGQAREDLALAVEIGRVVEVAVQHATLAAGVHGDEPGPVVEAPCVPNGTSARVLMRKLEVDNSTHSLRPELCSGTA